MILEDAKYMEINKLLLEGLDFKEVSKITGASENIARNLIDRLKATGSIFPSKKRTTIYDSVAKEIQEIIYSLLIRGRTSYNIYKKTSLTIDETYAILLSMGYNISKSKTKEYLGYCKNTIKDSYLNIVHTPGDAVEFDWGSIQLHIGDRIKTTRVYLAVFGIIKTKQFGS